MVAGLIRSENVAKTPLDLSAGARLPPKPATGTVRPGHADETRSVASFLPFGLLVDPPGHVRMKGIVNTLHLQ